MRKCWKCKDPLNNDESYCSHCGSEQLIREGMLGWSFLGFCGGLIVPLLPSLLIVLLLNDEAVGSKQSNSTLLNRSRWSAARKGWIVGMILMALIAFGALGLFIWVVSEIGY